MKKQILISVFFLLAGVLTVSASNIDGKWTGKVPGMDGGEIELTYVFKVDGEKLTGTISSEMGEVEISEGKVNGDEFEYKLDIQGMVMNTKGKVDGDEITLTTSSDWGDMETKLTRVKE